MYATVRRYEGIDNVRSEEITRKSSTAWCRTSASCQAFGYFLIDAGGGVLTSVSLFESSAQAEASTQLAAVWIREQDLDAALPNAPHITAGPLIALEPKREARG